MCSDSIQCRDLNSGHLNDQWTMASAQMPLKSSPYELCNMGRPLEATSLPKLDSIKQMMEDRHLICRKCVKNNNKNINKTSEKSFTKNTDSGFSSGQSSSSSSPMSPALGIANSPDSRPFQASGAVKRPEPFDGRVGPGLGNPSPTKKMKVRTNILFLLLHICHQLQIRFATLPQTTITIRGRITVWLVYFLTGLDSLVSVHTTYFLVWSNRNQFNKRQEWSFPPMVSIPWIPISFEKGPTMVKLLDLI